MDVSLSSNSMKALIRCRFQMQQKTASHAPEKSTGMGGDGLIEGFLRQSESCESLFQQHALLWICCIGFRYGHLEEIGVKHVHIITEASKPALITLCTPNSVSLPNIYNIMSVHASRTSWQESYACPPIAFIRYRDLPCCDRHSVWCNEWRVHGVYVPTKCRHQILDVIVRLHHTPQMFHT